MVCSRERWQQQGAGCLLSHRQQCHHVNRSVQFAGCVLRNTRAGIWEETGTSLSLRFHRKSEKKVTIPVALVEKVNVTWEGKSERGRFFQSCF